MSYQDRLSREIGTFKEVVNVHDLPDIFHYWSNKYLLPKCESLGFSSPNDFFVQYIQRAQRESAGGGTVRVLSVGAGNCDTEVEVAKLLRQRGVSDFEVTCLELNAAMLERGRALAQEQGLAERFVFLERDINGWEVDGTWHVVLANQSLHHFLELEALFIKIEKALHPGGFFITSDMIGRNGHMRWPEALEVVDKLWPLLPDRQRYNHLMRRYEPTYHNCDCSQEGFEGIRAQDILPLLLPRFRFDLFLGFANLISPFVDRGFGPNFDRNDPADLLFIDFVAQMDDLYIEQGRIKPTQMFAAMTRSSGPPPRVWKHLTPEWCVRWPGPPPAAEVAAPASVAPVVVVDWRRLVPPVVRQRLSQLRRYARV